MPPNKQTNKQTGERLLCVTIGLSCCCIPKNLCSLNHDLGSHPRIGRLQAMNAVTITVLLFI